VAAGAIVSCALTFVLLAFGVGLGLSTVSPWAGAGISATTFKIGTGLYLIVIAMLSSSIGGYLGGGLRSRRIGVHSDEVYFRATAHGFVAWAFAPVLGAVLLASPRGLVNRAQWTTEPMHMWRIGRVSWPVQSHGQVRLPF
jgi:hypothetical protein